MGYCLSLLSVEVTAEETEAVTFTTAVMDRSHAGVLRIAADILYPGLDKISFEEHLKSFYHYVLMQDEEQRRQSILLVDGWSDAEIVLQSLSFNKKTRPIVCFPGERRLRVPADADAAEKDGILYGTVKELMQEKEFSAAYLTGETLSSGWMKDSLNLICRGRRAFQGDTLYSKGAAYSTMAACGLASRADKYFYLSSDALRCNVGMQCLKKGRPVYQALSGRRDRVVRRGVPDRYHSGGRRRDRVAADAGGQRESQRDRRETGKHAPEAQGDDKAQGKPLT